MRLTVQTPGGCGSAPPRPNTAMPNREDQVVKTVDRLIKGQISVRRPHDHYVTPLPVICNFLDRYGPLPHGPVLDPAAGTGRFAEALRLRDPDFEIDQVEIDPTHADALQGPVGSIHIADFLQWQPTRRYRTIITNPPYSLAEEFIRRSMQLVDPANHAVIMLLRLAFLESRKRQPFWCEFPLQRLYVLSERPSFIGGATDQAAYAFFVWNTDRRQTIVTI